MSIQAESKTAASGKGLRARYERDGFCVAPQVFPMDVVERAVAGMDAIRRGEYDTGRPPEDSPWKPGDDPNILCKIEMPHAADRGVRELVTHPALGRLIADLTGASKVWVWWVQLLFKPPGGKVGTSVGWHQDKQYWQAWSPDSELLTCWAALSDVTENSGPVRFLRGSHRWGLKNAGDFFHQDIEAQKDVVPVPEGEQWDEVAAIIPPGGCSVHHMLTYHGSGPNMSTLPRRSFAIHLRTDRSRPADNVHELTLEQGRDLIKYIDDPYFNPLIYSR